MKFASLAHVCRYKIKMWVDTPESGHTMCLILGREIISSHFDVTLLHWTNKKVHNTCYI